MDQKLMDFFNSLDRAMFLDEEYKEYAHHDRALPIGHAQTISQPSLVLNMTDQLQLDKEHKVLEIGTGSGYQTVFLAEFAKTVYTIERIKELSCKAQNRLSALGYENIHFRIGDGSEGWSEHAPYDRIIVTAAAIRIPDELLEQLNINGRMVIPVGDRGLQDLLLIIKDNKGNIRERTIEKVAFVEFCGKYGWKRW